MVENRWRGTQVFSAFEFDDVALVPLATSTQQSTDALFNAPASVNRDTRGVVTWWLETTASLLIDGATVSTSTGASAGVVVIPNSSNARNSGIVISNSTGDIGIAFTGSTVDGGVRLFYGLATGQVRAGSTFDFST